MADNETATAPASDVPATPTSADPAPSASTTPKVLTVVVPCHNEQDTAQAFYDATSAVAAGKLAPMGVTVRYVFVDDGSRDRTLEVLRALDAAHPEVSYLSFSRNFGKEAALFAGLTAAARRSDLVAVMDADLQDPPTLLPQMVEKALSGEYDRVAARRTSREGEPPIRSWFARRFYSLMNHLTDLDLRDGARDFSVMTRRFVEAVLSCGEYNRFTKGCSAGSATPRRGSSTSTSSAWRARRTGRSGRSFTTRLTGSSPTRSSRSRCSRRRAAWSACAHFSPSCSSSCVPRSSATRLPAGPPS